MAFIDGNDPHMSLLIGPQSGAERLFRLRANFSAGFFVGLHTHRGDESFEVISGEVRFYVGGERQPCWPGAIIFAPRDVEHGFVALTDATPEVFSEQRMNPLLNTLHDEPRVC
ncbi:MAG: cupin domain-containing protein [Chloroflexota bacterium]|nr:cupin domain-containing protein [Chloroflexota bacterium]